MKLVVRLAWCALAGTIGVVFHVMPVLYPSGHLFWPSIVWPMPSLFLLRIGLFAIVLAVATWASARMSKGWKFGVPMAAGYLVGLLTMTYAYWVSASFYGRNWGPSYNANVAAVHMVIRSTGLWAGLCGALTGYMAVKLTTNRTSERSSGGQTA